MRYITQNESQSQILKQRAAMEMVQPWHFTLYPSCPVMLILYFVGGWHLSRGCVRKQRQLENSTIRVPFSGMLLSRALMRPLSKKPQFWQAHSIFRTGFSMRQANSRVCGGVHFMTEDLSDLFCAELAVWDSWERVSNLGG